VTAASLVHQDFPDNQSKVKRESLDYPDSLDEKDCLACQE
jgi:hypothetical protein